MLVNIEPEKRQIYNHQKEYYTRGRPKYENKQEIYLFTKQN